MVLELQQRQGMPAQVVEKPVKVEVVKEKIVEREKVLSGSELLNKIFFNKG
jgi:hypothetical protein